MSCIDISFWWSEEDGSVITEDPVKGSCYDGVSPNPVCTLDDFEWRCPKIDGRQTACGTERRGQCVLASEPFYGYAPHPSYQYTKSCN